MEGLGRRMTDEQFAIIESEEPTFKINALAQRQDHDARRRGREAAQQTAFLSCLCV